MENPGPKGTPHHGLVVTIFVDNQGWERRSNDDYDIDDVINRQMTESYTEHRREV